MKPDRERNLQDLLVFFLLVAIGVAGRWAEPTWCFTPTAAAALFAGMYFSRIFVAALVPITILAVSDLVLPPHDNFPVMFATYGIMVLPVWLGRLQRQEQSKSRAALKWVMFGLVPATLFYIVTNFAVWAFQSDYPKTLLGLRDCYIAAVPFFRWMLAGDVFYLTLLLGCLAIAGVPRQDLVPVKEIAK